MPSDLKVVQTNVFLGGQHSDIADELMPTDTYRYMLNCTVLSSSAGSVGVVTNIKGNTLMSTDMPLGQNICIGVANDDEVNKFYFFTWNSLDFHCIWQYDGLRNTITKVLANIDDTQGVDILKFDKDYLILHADVINNDLLYWVDGKNNARKTSLSKLLDKSAMGYGGAVLEEYIEAYKKAPEKAPIASYFTDSTRPFNKLYGAIRKFAQMYVYRDNERSVYSDFSLATIPEEEPFTGINTIPENNNGIAIEVQTGSADVKEIEIVMLSSSDAGNWSQIAVLNKRKLGIIDNSTYTYRYYNDTASVTINQSEIIRPYSFIPIQPLCQFFAKRVLGYANGVEGFPEVAVNVGLSVSYEDLFIPEGTTPVENSPIFDWTPGPVDYVSAGELLIDAYGNPIRVPVNFPFRVSTVTLRIGNDVKKGNKFELNLTNGYPQDTFPIEYTATVNDEAETVAFAIKNKLLDTKRIFKSSPQIPVADIFVDTKDSQGNIEFSFLFAALGSRYVEGYTETKVNPVNYDTLKDTGSSVKNQKMGVSYKMAIIYEDFDGRKSLSYTSPDMLVNIDTVNEWGKLKTSTVSLEINHKPPIWAKDYQIVRTSDHQQFIQFLIQSVSEVESTTTSEYLDLTVGSLFTFQKIHPDTTLNYPFEKGDRLRLLYRTDTDAYYDFFETEIISYSDFVDDIVRSNIKTDGSNTVTVDSARDDNKGKFIIIDGSEREILSAPTATTYLLNAPIGGSEEKTYLFYNLVDRRGTIRIKKPASPVVVHDNSIIEVYKPFVTQDRDKIFYEFGQKYPIIQAGTPNAVHGGNIQNQTLTSPAVVKVEGGTVYVRNRELPITNSVPGAQVRIHPIEDPSYSDFYESLLNDNGRVNAEDTGQGRKRFGSRVWYSNNQIEDTRINGLNMFDALDREDYNDQYGDIKLTKFDVNRIFVFKELKTAFIPVDSVISMSADGQPLSINTGKILNPIQYFAYEGGIGDNPESYASNANQKYAIYPNAGVIVRLGGNGAEPVSKTWGLDSRARRILSESANNGAKIIGGFDRVLGEYIVSVEGHNKYAYKDDMAPFSTRTSELSSSTQFQIVTHPAHGTVTLSGSNVIYNPDPLYSGEDSFTYRAMIGGSWSDPKKACITVIKGPDLEPVSVDYSIAYGLDPSVQTGLVFTRNGQEVARVSHAGSGSLVGVFKERDVIGIRQITYMSSFPWPPSSNANLRVTVDSDEKYNGNRTDQAIEMQSYTLTIPIGTGTIEAETTGSSTAPGYKTRTLTTNNPFGNNALSAKIVDQTDSKEVIDVTVQAGQSAFNFNTLDNADLLTVSTVNKTGVTRNIRVEGISGYIQSSYVGPNETYILNDVPKGSVDVFIEAI